MSHPEAMGGPVKREEGAKVKFNDFQVFEELFHRNGDSFLIHSRGRKNLNVTNTRSSPGIGSRPGN